MRFTIEPIMKNFHDYYFGLTNTQRDALVAKAGTTISYAERVAGGYRLPSVPMCLRIIRASGGKTSFKSIVETYEKQNGAIV